jgi:acetylornithine deacetylase/succinyl-diaminopimelate desuccinylase-like protein
VELIRRQLDREGFEDVQIETLMSCGPISLEPDHPLVELLATAGESVWGRRPVVIPSIAGGGPFAAFADALGCPTLVAPYAQADLHEHSADEHLSIEWFVNGIKTSAELYRLLAEG